MSGESFESVGKPLAFGDWRLELRGDEFADIQFRGHSVLRSVRAVVRDHDWNTAELEVASLKIEAASDGDGGVVKLAVLSHKFGASFSGEVQAHFAGSRASFKMELTSEHDFLTNRTGLIVLHEPELAGLPLEVTHSNLERERLSFPVSISPNQPVCDIIQLKWSSAGEEPYAAIDVRFEGDVFEMEDQRNWTDASYKTYSRPLSRPFPYLVPANETVNQALSIEVSAPEARVDSNDSVVIKLDNWMTAPEMQVGASTAPGEQPAFREFLPTELVEVDLASSNWRAALKRSQLGGLALDVRVIASSADLAMLPELISMLNNAPLRRIGIFDAARHVTTPELLAQLHDELKRASMQVSVVSGARSHFTELNREQSSILPNAQSICFASTPLFHSTSAEQLLESVAMQRLTAQQAVELAGNKPVHVGPITLRPRFNNVATAKQPGPTREDLDDGYGANFTGSVDDRQGVKELAAWTIASAAAFSVPGVETITWFEAWGPRGIRNIAGKEFAVAEALAALNQLRGNKIATGSDARGELWVIGCEVNGNWQLLASNLSRSSKCFQVEIGDQLLSIELESLAWAKVLV